MPCCPLVTIHGHLRAIHSGIVNPLQTLALVLLQAVYPSVSFLCSSHGAHATLHSPLFAGSWPEVSTVQKSARRHSSVKTMSLSSRQDMSEVSGGSPESSTPSVGQKVRDSGMPPMEYWETLYDVEGTLDRLGLLKGLHSKVLEFGCGYGTFSLPVARRVQKLCTFDIEGSMVDLTCKRAESAGLANIDAEVRDVVADGYGTPAGSCDAALLFNILHCTDPVQMLQDAASLLSPSGRLYAIHWRYDAATPRGPPLNIRPRPEQLEEWALATGLLKTIRGPVDCPPWHYGWVFERI